MQINPLILGLITIIGLLLFDSQTFFDANTKRQKRQ